MRPRTDSTGCPVRRIAPSDRPALTAFYAGLSTDALEARFLGATPGIGERAARLFCGPDHRHREGLVAESADESGRTVIVGHICLEPVDDETVEMAIAVADRWQRHGIGRELLERAIAWARGHGYTRLSASMRWSNGAVIGLIRSTGRPVTFGRGDGGIVDVILDVRATVPFAA